MLVMYDVILDFWIWGSDFLRFLLECTLECHFSLLLYQLWTSTLVVSFLPISKEHNKLFIIQFRCTFGCWDLVSWRNFDFFFFMMIGLGWRLANFNCGCWGWALLLIGFQWSFILDILGWVECFINLIFVRWASLILWFFLFGSQRASILRLYNFLFNEGFSWRFNTLFHKLLTFFYSLIMH